jgi:hypothetical protein
MRIVRASFCRAFAPAPSSVRYLRLTPVAAAGKEGGAVHHLHRRDRRRRPAARCGHRRRQRRARADAQPDPHRDGRLRGAVPLRFSLMHLSCLGLPCLGLPISSGRLRGAWLDAFRLVIPPHLSPSPPLLPPRQSSSALASLSQISRCPPFPDPSCPCLLFGPRSSPSRGAGQPGHHRDCSDEPRRRARLGAAAAGPLRPAHRGGPARLRRPPRHPGRPLPRQAPRDRRRPRAGVWSERILNMIFCLRIMRYNKALQFHNSNALPPRGMLITVWGWM